MVEVGSNKPPIINCSSAIPETDHCCQLSKAANGTPTKFTKSLPAKAKAKEKVPERITILKILTLKAIIKIWKIMLKPTNMSEAIINVLSLIHATHSGCMKLAFLAPFMIKK